MAATTTNRRTPDFQLLFDGQRRIEDKLIEVSVTIAKTSDHSPRLTTVEQLLMEARISLGQLRLIGIIAMPLLAAAISIATHYILAKP